MSNMRTFIKPGTHFDFMSVKNRAFLVSAILVLVSLVSLAVKKFNFGVEFAGGSSAIVAFELDSVPERSAIAASIDEVLRERLHLSDSQVSVQDFGAGAGDTIAGKPVRRFLVYTEATSLVDSDARTRLGDALEKAYPGQINVASSEDAGDTMYLVFNSEVPIADTKGKLAELFAKEGFEKIAISADLERQVEVDFLRDVDLQQQDEAAGEVVEGAKLGETDRERRLQEAIAGKGDTRFTVDIEALRAAFEAQFEKDFSSSFIAVESSATVSPSVGSALFSDALLAIVYSLIGILIYVTLRFDFRYAPGGVVALAHDAIIMMGFVSLANLKFSLTIVAALLTIIGYSINDTIIIYDRIRELAQGKTNSNMLTLINQGINDTLSRTAVTSLTTILAILILLFFGGAQIFDFAVSVTLGLIVGTYSSVFVASPFVHLLDGYAKRREAEREEARKNRFRGDNSKAKA